MKNRVDVHAIAFYLEDQSTPEIGQYAFAYTITIINRGEQPAQLISRHWIITDANDEVQEVRGDGVVGEQPVLSPGGSYEYTSGTLMSTPMGTMRGSYQMIAEDGTEFSADIPIFTLKAEKILH